MHRIQPAGPTHAYRTFGIAAPLGTHWRKATCAEAECANYLNGWRTILPASSDLHAVVRGSGRHYTQETIGDLIEYTFPAGQECFHAAEHRVRGFAAEVFYTRGGDWRGVTAPVETIADPDEWVGRFQENQQSIIHAQERG